MKNEMFDAELTLIKDENIKTFAKEAIEQLPDYFFTIPASSTGKYHPAYTTGEGGLVRHVKACVRIAFELFRLDWWHFTDEERDLILVALLLHDGWKNGIPDAQTTTNFTATKHPLVASSEIKRLFWDSGTIPNEQIEYICAGIATHMGQWNKDYRSGEEVLELPKDKHQKFIHLADYLASRKCLEMNFDVQLSEK